VPISFVEKSGIAASPCGSMKRPHSAAIPNTASECFDPVDVG
jgi:hypothetical protein